MKKTCGVIGGMGPLATVDFLNRIINCTDASVDGGHMHVIADSNTSIPDRSAFVLSNGSSPEEELIKSAVRLENAGADFLVMTCNTAHLFYEKISSSVNIPFINMIDEVAAVISKEKINCVGLLATTGTISSGLYEDYLKEYGIQLIIPSDNDQTLVMDFIYKIKGMHSSTESPDISNILSIIEHMKQHGAQAIILGCTELPIALNDDNTNIRCIDATQILAEKAVKYAGYDLLIK